jgi:hypothetical protein
MSIALGIIINPEMIYKAITGDTRMCTASMQTLVLSCKGVELPWVLSSLEDPEASLLGIARDDL